VQLTTNGTTAKTDYYGNSTLTGAGSHFVFEDLEPATAVFVRATKSGYTQIAEATIASLDEGTNEGAEGLTVTISQNATMSIISTGLTGRTATVTFTWTAPAGMTSQLVHPVNANETQTLTFPGNVLISSGGITISDSNTGNLSGEVLATSEPADVDDAETNGFTLTPGSTTATNILRIFWS
jgi:hypothetical protein